MCNSCKEILKDQATFVQKTVVDGDPDAIDVLNRQIEMAIMRGLLKPEDTSVECSGYKALMIAFAIYGCS